MPAREIREGDQAPREDMKASIADTEFPTLYDAWTQQDDATVE
jgi:hypothetical protein